MDIHPLSSPVIPPDLTRHFYGLAYIHNMILSRLKRTRANASCTRHFLRGIRRLGSTSSGTNSEVADLLSALQNLDTSSLCDADKSLLTDQEMGYAGLRLLNEALRPLNHRDKPSTMVGVARTVQATQKDDFLCVLRGLEEAQPGEILVVSTLSSSRACAGELFCAEAERRGLAGIIIDGPARDTAHLDNYSIRFYATSISPYSGSIQSVGKMQEVVQCGGVEVQPGDILVGDCDGIVVGNFDSFQNLLSTAQNIQSIEEKLRERITSGTSLASMTNFREHLDARLKGTESSLEFRV